MRKKLPFFLLPLLFWHCFEPKEGCLDIAATNFEAAADNPCPDCCTYPQLGIEVIQRYDTLTFLENRNYPSPNGQWFRLNSAAFYLSDFQLFQSGTPLQVSDTVQLQAFAATGPDTVKETLTDDILLVRRTPVQYNVGEFRPDGSFESLQWRLGLPEAAQRVIPRLAPSNHPLRLQSDNLWKGRDTGFVFLRLVLARDTLPGTQPDTLSFTKADLPNALFTGNGPFQHAIGYNFNLKLTVDYKRMLEGINWATGSISAWKSQITDNLPAAFILSQ
jgi:hypothetical protein